MHGSTQKKDILIYEDETFSIRGAVFDIYKEMSNGFLESVYQECSKKNLRPEKFLLLHNRN